MFDVQNFKNNTHLYGNIDYAAGKVLDGENVQADNKIATELLWGFKEKGVRNTEQAVLLEGRVNEIVRGLKDGKISPAVVQQVRDHVSHWGSPAASQPGAQRVHKRTVDKLEKAIADAK